MRAANVTDPMVIALCRTRTSTTMEYPSERFEQPENSIEEGAHP